jgi:hypothetical protein
MLLIQIHTIIIHERYYTCQVRSFTLVFFLHAYALLLAWKAYRTSMDMQDTTQIFPPPKKEKQEKKIQKFAEEESRVLFQAKSVFPFSLFPDKILIYPTKVDVVIGEFFRSNYTKTFFIQDIGGAEIITTPFMASVKITGNKMGGDPILVPNFRRKDAIRVKEVIDGLLVAHKREHELKEIKSKEAVPHLRKAGESQGEK